MTLSIRDMQKAIYEQAISLDVRKLTGGQVDTLVALVEKGPLWPGDRPSKIARDELVELGLADHIVAHGEDGYSAATYAGRDIYKKLFGNSDTISEAQRVRKLGVPS